MTGSVFVAVVALLPSLCTDVFICHRCAACFPSTMTVGRFIFLCLCMGGMVGISLNRSRRSVKIIIMNLHATGIDDKPTSLEATKRMNASVQSRLQVESIHPTDIFSSKANETTTPQHILDLIRATSATLDVISTTNGKRPSLESIVQGWNITADPQFLLDFAILGFPKCGTSTMMQWLGQHPEAQCFRHEVNDLKNNKPTELIKRLYYKLPEGNYKRGYKSPSEIELDHIRDHLARLFPQTKVVIGIRHPVRWFESFYNFRTQNLKSMPHANTLIGPCTKEKKGVCTNRGLFHLFLAKLGKSNMTSPLEEKMMNRHKRMFRNGPPTPQSFPNKTFLFTTEQLGDVDEMRMDVFGRVVQEFVGFRRAMPPIVHWKPGKTWDNATQAEKDSRKINICDHKYKELRDVLMDISREASEWIRNYFIESEDVVVSSRDYIEQILGTWMHDPCDANVSVAEA